MSATRVSRLLAAFLFLTSSMSALAQGSPIALTHVNLFDGTKDEITEDVTVFVRDGLIERIATGDVHISGDYEVIDAEGNYLMHLATVSTRGSYAYGYYPHNIHFVLTSALMAGDGKTSLAYAKRLEGKIPDAVAAKVSSAITIRPRPTRRP